MYLDTRLPAELQEIAENLAQVARSHGLDFYDTSFELIDYNQLAEIAAYGGFPTRYPHWRFGMEYERIAKSYTYGLSIIYEMVINNNPCYAYLLRANNLVYQRTVIAHVYGHCDFFKNNFYFSGTNRKMLNQMANHATTVRQIIDEVGHDKVEDFIDLALSLENLVDPKDALKSEAPRKKTQESTVHKMPAKKYMDSYINRALEDSNITPTEPLVTPVNFPEEPLRDVLGFLATHAPLNEWQKMILNIIRAESLYFLPQGQTKILNEGWATYWHSLMMTQLAPLSAGEIVDYCDHYAGVVASHPNGMNPYRLGLQLLRHIKERWDKGRHGLEYLECDDPKRKVSWDNKSMDGMKKLFEVRRIHNDVTFIDEFLDEDFCHFSKMFLYDFDPSSGKHVISSRNFRDIKKAILNQLTNFGQPIIRLTDANYLNRSELLLKHQHEGSDLKKDFAAEVLRNLYRVWTRPVHLETIVEGSNHRLSFDGSKHHSDKY